MSLQALGKIFFGFKKRFAPDKSFVKNTRLSFVTLIYHHRTWDKVLLPFCRLSSGNKGELNGIHAHLKILRFILDVAHQASEKQNAR